MPKRDRKGKGDAMKRLRAMALAALGVVTFGSVVMAGKKGGTRSVASAKDGTAVSSQAAAAVSTNGTGNLSQERRKELVKKIAEIRRFLAKSSDTNAVRLVAFADELAKEVKAKKYGLVFEEHKEKIDVQLENCLPMLTEDRNRFIDNGGELNFLIEGDNLAALKLLEKTHRGKIDLIYIDPPYNTGNKDFVYNDQYVDTNDTFRHSKWLSFMKKRLEIAWRLLSRKGILFISIDDNEQANLRVLCDDILGESSLVSVFPRVTKKAGKTTNAVASNHDYVMCYSRGANPKFNSLELHDGKYRHEDEYVETRGRYALSQTLDYDTLGYVHSLDYPITIDGNVYYPGSVSKAEHLKRKKENPKDGFRWRWSKELFEFGYDNGFVVVKTSRNGARIYTKTYERAKIESREGKYEVVITERGKNASTLDFVDNQFSNDNARKDLDKIFNEKAFDYAKPVALIERLSYLASSTNSVVLDFFAGSGTTGHAVMSLNAKDGGKRKFILVTNNENGICEKVTYERLKRVIEKENYAARLKYMKIDYLPIEERMYDRYAEDLLKHVRELVELENGLDFGHETGVAIVLTDAEAEALAKDKKRLAACRVIYKGHNVLLGEKTAAAFEKSGVTIRPIPKYYYPELEY